MHRVHGFFIFRLADANGDVDLARALHDHPHVDAGASERTEQTAGDARLSRHVPSDDGHRGKPVCNADAVRADGGGNVRQKRLAAGGDRRGRGDERDAAKPRCDVVKGDLVRFEHRENPAAVQSFHRQGDANMRNKIIENAIDSVVNASNTSSDFKLAFRQYVKNKFDDNAKESDLKRILTLIEDDEEDIQV